MRWLPRTLIALAILASGLALTPVTGLPAQRFSWQLFAVVYHEPVNVSIQDFSYIPDPLEIPVGTTVRWTNNDSEEHTVTSDTQVFDSGTLESGEIFEYRFDTPGTYTYHCELHSSMQGTVIVEE